jgi:hypothetical protein
MFINLDTEIWATIKVTHKKGAGKGVVGGGRVGKLLCFVAFMCIWAYFRSWSAGCLCQGLQGTGLVYSWYSRLCLLQIHTSTLKLACMQKWHGMHVVAFQDVTEFDAD